MGRKSNGWIQVSGADELRPAMLVELRPCGFCGATERFMLLRLIASTAASLTSEGDLRATSASWSIAPGLCLHRGCPFDPSAAIADGRLWRRADVTEQSNARGLGLARTDRAPG